MERRLTETRYDGTGLPATRRLSDSGRLAGGQGGKEAGKKEAGREEGGRPAVGRAGSTSRPPQRAGPPRASAFPQRRLQPRGWARLPACPSPLHPRPGLGGGVGGGCGGINPGLGGVRVSGFVKVSGWVRGERWWPRSVSDGWAGAAPGGEGFQSGAGMARRRGCVAGCVLAEEAS